MLKSLKPLFVIIFGILMCLPSGISAQEPSTYKLDFVRAANINNDNVVVVLRVIPLVKKFKRVLSMRLGYSLDGEEMVTCDLMKQNRIRIIVYGTTVEKESRNMYEFINAKMPIEKEQEGTFYLAFYFELGHKLDSMSVKYGLWEGRKSDTRIEKQFNFHVEPSMQ